MLTVLRERPYSRPASSVPRHPLQVSQNDISRPRESASRSQVAATLVVASYSTSSAPTLNAKSHNILVHSEDDAAVSTESSGDDHPVESIATFEPPHVRSMARLRALLSRQDALPSLTVRDIRHRYALWKSSAVLNDLRSDDLSSLIRLLGTLSVSEYGKPQHIPHSHPHALHMPRTNFAPHWEFIERIGHDKRWLRYPLLPSDHYWLMRAALARYTAQTGETVPNWYMSEN